jgi:hypothetical protein
MIALSSQNCVRRVAVAVRTGTGHPAHCCGAYTPVRKFYTTHRRTPIWGRPAPPESRAKRKLPLPLWERVGGRGWLGDAPIAPSLQPSPARGGEVLCESGLSERRWGEAPRRADDRTILRAIDRAALPPAPEVSTPPANRSTAKFCPKVLHHAPERRRSRQSPYRRPNSFSISPLLSFRKVGRPWLQVAARGVASIARNSASISGWVSRRPARTEP